MKVVFNIQFWDLYVSCFGFISAISKDATSGAGEKKLLNLDDELITESHVCAENIVQCPILLIDRGPSR